MLHHSVFRSRGNYHVKSVEIVVYGGEVAMEFWEKRRVILRDGVVLHEAVSASYIHELQ